MSEKPDNEARAWAGGVAIGVILGVAGALFASLFIPGCHENKNEKQILEVAVAFDERLTELEEEQGAVWEAVNDMDTHLPSPTPEYESEECPEEMTWFSELEKEISCDETAGRLMVCWAVLDWCRNGELAEQKLEACLKTCDGKSRYDGATPAMNKECVGRCREKFGEL